MTKRFSCNSFAHLGLKIFLDGFAYTEENFFTNVARDSMADFAADDVVRLVARKISQKNFFYLVSYVFFGKKRERERKKLEKWEGGKMCIYFTYSFFRAFGRALFVYSTSPNPPLVDEEEGP